MGTSRPRRFGVGERPADPTAKTFVILHGLPLQDVAILGQ